MTLNEYQALAQRTSNTSGRDKVVNGVLGLTGEAGECADIVKKHMYQGHSADRTHLLEEVGDCLWYVAELAAGLGVSLEAVAWANICKLRTRYPDGFETDKSIHRKV